MTTKGEKQIRRIFIDSDEGDSIRRQRERPFARLGEHYGPYGIACINTGQFDAGECWKCEIKRLRIEREALKDQLNGYENPWKATLAEFQKDYCPMGCIFGLNKHGKLHLYGDCRAPESEHCKANLKSLMKRGGSDG